MQQISSINRIVILVAWTVSGHAGCTPAADVRTPDVDDCPLQSYRVTEIAVPLSVGDAIRVGFDLDGDGIRDNWLGFANTLLHAWSPEYDVAPVVAARLAGDVEWMLDVRQCAAYGPASVVLGAGAEADALPARGDHSPGAAPLTGGTFGVPLGAISDALGGATVGWAAAPMAQIRIDAIDDVAAQATVDVAIAYGDVVAIVAPNLAAYFTARLAANDSDFALDADVDGDRVVTADELMASDTARVLLAPDLEDRDELGGDGFSLGFGIEATR